MEAVERGKLDLRATATALDDAVHATHPYPRWVSTAGSAALAGSLALLLGSPWIAVLAAFVITAVIDVKVRLLTRRRLPSFFRQVVGGSWRPRRRRRSSRSACCPRAPNPR